PSAGREHGAATVVPGAGGGSDGRGRRGTRGRRGADRGRAGGVRVRGRLVMLVDNGVVGDSRVQKAARSAADAGWDVTLLGRSPVAERREWTLGSANVVLVNMPDPLARRRHTFRRAWLRWPLAYPP